ncbi:MAG TPA: hypothetical protein PLS90_17095 [Candidatus Sumerlaeota bacterium]|nr:hypothetical protein [Candidatus Sumerlaeota bacterium]HPK04164.1 hypothetical protein [Candidatus Sumerlaeota bacterium]
MTAQPLTARQPAMRRPSPPFTALRSAFLRRTAVAIGATACVVAALGAAGLGPRWGGQYFLAALWSTLFLALTPLIIKTMLFDRRMGLGVLLMGAKLGLMVVLYLTCRAWVGGEAHRLQVMTAVLSGLVTPLLVVTLRAIGAIGGGESRESVLREIRGERRPAAHQTENQA